ncbi:hypothetical protein LTS10_009769 [Elasticomyces elasticus]|nr:hypothetical protein LTS10_009769 [Elasticomyces elasticus]
MDELDSLKQEYGAALPPSLRPGATERTPILSSRTPTGLSDGGPSQTRQITPNITRSSTFTPSPEPGHARLSPAPGIFRRGSHVFSPSPEAGHVKLLPGPGTFRTGSHVGTDRHLAHRPTIRPVPDADKRTRAIVSAWRSRTLGHREHSTVSPEGPTRTNSGLLEPNGHASAENEPNAGTSSDKRDFAKFQQEAEDHDTTAVQPKSDTVVHSKHSLSGQLVRTPRVRFATVESDKESGTSSAEQSVASRERVVRVRRGSSQSTYTVHSWHGSGTLSIHDDENELMSRGQKTSRGRRTQVTDTYAPVPRERLEELSSNSDADTLDDDGLPRSARVPMQQTQSYRFGDASDSALRRTRSQRGSHLSFPGNTRDFEVVEGKASRHGGHTRIPKRLAHSEVLQKLEYPFQEHADSFVIDKSLSRAAIDQILGLSERHKVELSPAHSIHHERTVSENRETSQEDEHATVRAAAASTQKDAASPDERHQTDDSVDEKRQARILEYEEKITREEQKESIHEKLRQGKDRPKERAKAMAMEEREAFIQQQKKRDAKIQSDGEMRRRLMVLEDLGFHREAHNDYMVDERNTKQHSDPRDDQERQNASNNKRPHYAKIHLDYLDVQTLHHYNLPYTVDPRNSNYVIIRREMGPEGADVLFEHTKRRRVADAVRLAEADAPVPWQTEVEQFWRKSVPKAQHLLNRSSSTEGVHATFARHSSVSGDSSSSSQAIKFSEEIDALKPMWHCRHDQTWKNLSGGAHLDNVDVSAKLTEDLHFDNGIADKVPSTLKCVVHSTFDETIDRGTSRQHNPLFRTVDKFKIPPKAALFFVKHIQQATLDFAGFKAEVMALNELREFRHKVEEHLTQDWTPQDNAARPTGFMQVKGRLFEAGDITITAVCSSFVYPEARSRTSGDVARETQLQTLFQSLYRSGDRRQDFNQAICNMPRSRSKHILCVTQLWAIIINKDILITCATMSEAELYGTLLSSVPQPAKEWNSSDVADLRVTDPDGKLWLLKRSRCNSFLDFACHFSDVSLAFCDDLTIYLDGEVIGPREWSRAFQVSDNAVIHLKLRRNNRGIARELAASGVRATELLFGQQYEMPKNTVLRQMVRGLDLRPSTSLAPRLCYRSTGLTASSEPRQVLSAVTESLVETVRYIPFFAAEPNPPAPDRRSSGGRLPELPADLHHISVHDFDDMFTKWLNDVASRCETVVEGNITAAHGRLDALFLDHPAELGQRTFKDAQFIADGDTDADTDTETDADAETETNQVPDHLGTEELMARCDLIYAYIFNGLTSTLGIFRATSGVSQVSTDETPNLLGVLFNFTTTLNEVIFPQPKLWSADLLWRVWRCLESLLTASLLLGPYGFTWQHMPPEDAYHMFRSMVLDLHRLTRLIRELDTLYERPNPGQSDETVGATLYRLITELRRLKGGGYHESSEWRARLDAFEALREQGTNDPAGPKSINSIMTALDEVGNSVKRNTRQLTAMFETHLVSSTDPLRTMAAAGACDLLTMLLRRITHLPVIHEGDAMTMYLKYMTELETSITTSEPSREWFESLRYLRYELNAISQLQTAQRKALERYYAHVHEDFAKLDKADSGRKVIVPDKNFAQGAWLLYSLIDQLRKQNNIIRLLDGNIPSLQDQVQAQLSSQEAWRSNAGVVFTVITVLFLPPSFVASVLGMNTADIRNTAHAQWVYWASAVPLTIVVIAITLYFVDVPPLRRWWARRKGYTAPWLIS